MPKTSKDHDAILRRQDASGLAGSTLCPSVYYPFSSLRGHISAPLRPFQLSKHQGRPLLHAISASYELQRGDSCCGHDRWHGEAGTDPRHRLRLTGGTLLSFFSSFCLSTPDLNRFDHVYRHGGRLGTAELGRLRPIFNKSRAS